MAEEIPKPWTSIAKGVGGFETTGATRFTELVLHFEVCFLQLGKNGALIKDNIFSFVLTTFCKILIIILTFHKKTAPPLYRILIDKNDKWLKPDSAIKMTKALQKRILINQHDYFTLKRKKTKSNKGLIKIETPLSKWVFLFWNWMYEAQFDIPKEWIDYILQHDWVATTWILTT